MKHLYLFFVFLVISSSSHSKSNHLIKHIEALSRDYFYIDFIRDTSSYKNQSVIGGEHETHYYLLGFEADTFVIKIYSDPMEVGYVPRNDNYKILSTYLDEENKTNVIIVKVLAQHAWVDVSFSAHPFAEYTIEVEKLETLE